MAFTRSSALWATAGLTLLAGLARAHDDDPKLLSKQPIRPGQGLRVGLTPPPGFPAGSAYQSGMFTSSGVTLLSWITAGTLAQGGGTDCWGYTSSSGREYAIYCGESGTSWVEITNPNNPQIIAQKPGINSSWRDAKIYQDHCYVVTEGGDGIQIFDMSAIDSGTVSFLGTVITGGSAASHNVAIDEASARLYRIGGSGNGLRIYSLANKASPTFIGAWNTKYVHDAQIVTYTSGPYAGKQIAFTCSGLNGGWAQPSLTIVDVTNAASPVILDENFYSNANYSHQGWLSGDRNYFYLNDELDEYYGVNPTTTTRLFDVSNLSNAIELSTFTNGNTAIDHNLYVRDDLIFEANYRSGLRVYETSGTGTPTAPKEVRWFDTYVADDAPQFNGLWSNYPYFPSGVVIGSDRENGLFVWWANDPQLAFSYPSGAPATVNAAGQNVPVQITVNAKFNTSIKPGSETLHYSVNSGAWTTAGMAPQGGGLYDAPFPAVACNANIDWYVTAESANSIVWADPPDAPGSYLSSTALCGGPTVYCTGKTNSLGCVPSIGWSGSSSASASSGFDISATNVRNNKVGLLFYSLSGQANTAFQCGTLCMTAPIRRTPAINAGGSPNPANDCTGVFSIDMNCFAANACGGNPAAGLAVPGNTVESQFWGRDQGYTPPCDTALTNALEHTVGV